MIDKTQPPPGWEWVAEGSDCVTRNGRDWYTLAEAWDIAEREAEPIVAAMRAERDAAREEIGALKAGRKRQRKRWAVLVKRHDEATRALRERAETAERALEIRVNDPMWRRLEEIAAEVLAAVDPKQAEGE